MLDEGHAPPHYEFILIKSAKNQISSCSEVLGVRTSTWELLGDTMQPLTDGDVNTCGDMSFECLLPFHPTHC